MGNWITPCWLCGHAASEGGRRWVNVVLLSLVRSCLKFKKLNENENEKRDKNSSLSAGRNLLNVGGSTDGGAVVSTQRKHEAYENVIICNLMIQFAR